jgi:molecular chaperone GrpE (heat shock protein)
MADHQEKHAPMPEKPVTEESTSPTPLPNSAPISLISVDSEEVAVPSLTQEAVRVPNDSQQDLEERFLRLSADFENFRKRAEKEKDDVRRYGIDKLLGDLLPVLDSMDLAFFYRHDGEDPFVRGLQLVRKQAEDVLARYGVK